jgi:zona occludens toxin
MIIFHEGLPRSGKSYEACVRRVIPALKAGRKVYAYIEGLNHEKFAEVTGLPLERIKALLFQIEADQVKDIYNRVENDSLVIIDELQDYWPTSRNKLDEDITKFITQHGHRGLDIICMGQDHRDCHSLWKRRIDQLYTFTKQDAIGRPSKYAWQSFKQRNGKFEKLNSGTAEYESQYFGLYLSHTKDTTNKETYNDDRANIFKTKAFRLYLPAVAVGVIFAVWYLIGIFTGDRAIVKMHETDKTHFVSTAPLAASPAVETKPPKKEELPKTLNHEQYIEQVMSNYKPRLAGLLRGRSKGVEKIIANIEFLDDTNHVKERLDLTQVKSLGWAVTLKPYGLLLTKGKTDVVVTAWPIDVYGKVSNHTSSQL